MFKKRIGLSQKVMKHPRYDEVMNCLDIEWFKFLMPLGVLPIPIPIGNYDQTISTWKELDLDGLILTGGNTITGFEDEKSREISPFRDDHEDFLIGCAISSSVPILGVCRGMQFINVWFKGNLSRVNGHAGTRHSISILSDHKNLLSHSEVNSYHDYSISLADLGKDLIPLACDAEGNIEALRHTKHKILGLMWHPEREEMAKQNDIQLIKGHFNL